MDVRHQRSVKFLHRDDYSYDSTPRECTFLIARSLCSSACSRSGQKLAVNRRRRRNVNCMEIRRRAPKKKRNGPKICISRYIIEAWHDREFNAAPPLSMQDLMSPRNNATETRMYWGTRARARNQVYSNK